MFSKRLNRVRTAIQFSCLLKHQVQSSSWGVNRHELSLWKRRVTHFVSCIAFFKTFNLFVDFSAQANVCCLGRVTPVYHSLVLRTFCTYVKEFLTTSGATEQRLHQWLHILVLLAFANVLWGRKYFQNLKKSHNINWLNVNFVRTPQFSVL